MARIKVVLGERKRAAEAAAADAARLARLSPVDADKAAAASAVIAAHSTRDASADSVRHGGTGRGGWRGGTYIYFR